MIDEMTTVRCLNETCEKEFDTTEMKLPTEIVTCPHCKSDHVLDQDSDGGGDFWYLHSIKSN